MKKKLVITLLSVFGLTFGQFKFGISPIGVSAIVNKDYNMARHGVGGFLEFAGLFKENYEVGVQIGYIAKYFYIEIFFVILPSVKIRLWQRHIHTIYVSGL
jgi:hypothetical protein